jgi:hypothetical protein
MTHAFYHVWLVNHWRDLVAEQLGRFRACGLGELCPLTIGAIGSSEDVGELACMLSGLQAMVVNLGPDGDQFEYPTLELLRAYCRQNDDPVLYFHSKGVSIKDCPSKGKHRKDMEAFVLDRWRDCVAALGAGFDVAGVRFRLKRGPLDYFAGNFWWARADYIRTLPDFVIQTRYDAELWVFQGNPKAFEHVAEEPLF